MTSGPLITDTTIPQGKGTTLVYAPLFLGVGGGKFGPHWNRTSAGNESLSAEAQMQIFYGAAERTEVYLVVPYRYNLVWNAEGAGPGAETSAHFGGLGDVSLPVKYLLADERDTRPAIALLLSTDFPTGHHSHLNPRFLGTDLLGSGSFTFILGLNLYKTLHKTKLYGNLWYGISTDATVNGSRLLPRDTATFNLAVEHPLAEQWIFLGELLSTWGGGRLIGRKADQPQQTILGILPAVEFIASKQWYFASGLKIDLFGRNTVYRYTPVIAAFCNF
ncbi:MAG TPA: transporter [Dissulfurispiraceae bacterium]